MKHRHLLPDEIDQLLDDELGFGMAPIKAHLSECDDCRGRYEDARAVTDLIDKLPHLVPSHRFAENVMSKVEVFVPWHVTARDTIAAWIPAAGRSRKVAVFAAAGITGVLTLVTLALATQSDRRQRRRRRRHHSGARHHRERDRERAVAVRGALRRRAAHPRADRRGAARRRRLRAAVCGMRIVKENLSK